MTQMNANLITVRRLTRGNRDDFYGVHSEANECAWCCCVAWWVPTWDGWGERTAEQNRRLRDVLFERGEYDGYLAYDGERPVAWCQVGLRDRLEKLTAQFDLAPDPSAWAITCLLVAPQYRRQGVARRVLGQVIAALQEDGVRIIEAYPKRGASDALDLWTGPEGLFVETGFRIFREHPLHPVYRWELPPPSDE